MCVVKQACQAGHMVIHLACLLWGITFCPSCPQTSFDICYGVSIGDKVFTKSTGLRVPAKVVGLLHDGHVELAYDQGGVQAVNHRCPMDFISFGIPSLESPPPSPSVPAIDALGKFFWTPLLTEAPFAVAPQHNHHHIPQPAASLGNGEFGG